MIDGDAQLIQIILRKFSNVSGFAIQFFDNVRMRISNALNLAALDAKHA